nr:hypothetical protein CFP56_16742 [Quercus suber]
MHSRESQRSLRCGEETRGVVLGGALEARDGERASGLGGRDQRADDGAADVEGRAGGVAKVIRRQRAGEGVLGAGPGLRGAAGMLRARDHVEAFAGGFEFGEQDLEDVAVVGHGPLGPGVRLADEAEELFPAAGDDEADEFGVGAEDLVLVDCALRRRLTSHLERFLAKAYRGDTREISRGHGAAVITSPDVHGTLETEEDVVGGFVVVESDGRALTTAGTDHRESILGLLPGDEQPSRGFGERNVYYLAILRGDYIWLARLSWGKFCCECRVCTNIGGVGFGDTHDGWNSRLVVDERRKGKIWLKGRKRGLHARLAWGLHMERK